MHCECEVDLPDVAPLRDIVECRLDAAKREQMRKGQWNGVLKGRYITRPRNWTSEMTRAETGKTICLDVNKKQKIEVGGGEGIEPGCRECDVETPNDSIKEWQLYRAGLKQCGVG